MMRLERKVFMASQQVVALSRGCTCQQNILSAEYVDRVCMNWKTLVDADEKTRKVEYYGVITPRGEPQLRLQSLLDLPSDHPLLTTFYKFGTAMCGSRKKVKCREGD